ncbi:MAG TPA: PD-(D/E)XK nuclease family protein [Isosphaeraceae bacterium]|nr:PD-(D/E)XK nuclease family protein [Isosphaeraceae bacterium]
MASERLLWTGPYGAALREHAIAGASTDPASLWLVGSPLARDQVRRELAMRCRGLGPGPRVWSWAELWRSVRDSLEGGRISLSAGAAGAVLSEAVRQARQAGEVRAIDTVLDWPGYRRRLRERIAEWTALERRLRDTVPVEPVAAAEWSVFVRYRSLLRQLGAEDSTGFAAWVARRLNPPPAPLAELDQVTFLDWEAPSRAQWRVLEHTLRRARSVRVTLVYESDATAGGVYEATVGIRDRLLKLGFHEVPVRPEIWRPAGLRAVEQSVFRQVGPRDEGARVAVSQGLTIRGAPQGEGAGRLLAREVRALLDRGTDPEEILILFRDWSEQADVALETLRAWGIPVQAEPIRPLGADPAVAALLLAIGLPIEDWATERLIRLLRHGQVRPVWPGADPLSLAAAASVLNASHVFRGRDPLRRKLDHIIHEDKGRSLKGKRAESARQIVEKFFALLDPLVRSRTFAEQVEEIVRVAEALRLGASDVSGQDAPPPEGPSDSAGLDALRDALEDQADLLDRLGRGETLWSWPAFVREVESVVLELRAPAEPPRPGSVRMTTVDQVEGARARFVILADLAEGTFPARTAVEPFLALRPGARPDQAGRLAFSREMLRFLRVLGSAESGVVLIYPTTDARGQELLRAGFLDELMELLTPEAATACHQAVARLDPALVDAPELAGSPADRRVRAVALARTRGDLAPLSELAGHPGHRPILDGSAAALQVLGRRARGTPFGEYDGLIGDGQAVLDIAETFAADYRFSASQLETYIACPFQFFCKYVLKLEPDERRDELDENYTERGSRIHKILEELEKLKQQAQDQESDEELARIAVGAELNVGMADASEIDLGLVEIERRRLIQTIERYVVQLRDYERDPEYRPIPHRFEVEFGKADSPYPYLELGRGPGLVRLQGKIDRIDLVETPEGRGFRVIDYKSGSGPSATEVRKARLLQLPLYAMAVEQIILADELVQLRDVGYWALRTDGYRPIVFDEWTAVQQALESYIAELVSRLRRGVFVVDSQVDGCEGFCDYRAICRVRQARQAAKRADRAVAPELAVGRAIRKRRGSGSSHE